MSASAKDQLAHARTRLSALLGLDLPAFDYEDLNDEEEDLAAALPRDPCTQCKKPDGVATVRLEKTIARYAFHRMSATVRLAGINGITCSL